MRTSVDGVMLKRRKAWTGVVRGKPVVVVEQGDDRVLLVVGTRAGYVLPDDLSDTIAKWLGDRRTVGR